MNIEDFMRLPPDTDMDQVSEKIQLKQAERAQLTEDVLRNEAFQHAFQELRAYLLVQWEETKPDDTYKRECLWNQFQCAQMFFDNLKTLMQTGRIAKVNLDLREKNSKIQQMLKKVGM